jgi:uncharacterized DUF497 family protein
MGSHSTKLRQFLAIHWGTTVPDPDRSLAEDRFITIAMSSRGRLVIVSHTERGERIRIISARELTRAESKAYEKETKK